MITALYLLLATASTPKSDSPQQASASAVKALLNGNWTAFRKMARPIIVVAEYWTAYADYFDKKVYAGSPLQGKLGPHEYGYVGNMSVLPNHARLTPSQEKLFRGFCGLMRDSASFATDKWAAWPEVSSTGVQRFECAALVAPCVSFKVASNLRLGIEFERVGGRYLVSRLEVIGH